MHVENKHSSSSKFEKWGTDLLPGPSRILLVKYCEDPALKKRYKAKFFQVQFVIYTVTDWA